MLNVIIKLVKLSYKDFDNNEQCTDFEKLCFDISIILYPVLLFLVCTWAGCWMGFVRVALLFHCIVCNSIRNGIVCANIEKNQPAS